jgi:hypothetical protein
VITSKDARVTALDSSPAQLARDQMAVGCDWLEITNVLGDLRGLSMCADTSLTCSSSRVPTVFWMRSR